MGRQAIRTLVVLLFISPVAHAGEQLSAEQYLKQVRSKNDEYHGNVATSQAATQRSSEGEIATSTSMFADMEYSSDARLPTVALFTYDKIALQRYTLGVRKLTSFGLEAKAYYSLMHTNYVNMGLPSAPPGFGVNFYDARPSIELTQSLWANGFGRGTQANEERARAAALASSFEYRHRAKALVAQAEAAYWRLSLARERLEITHTAFEQAEKSYNWNADRVKRSLADEVDMLQAKAALEARQLDLQVAKDEEKLSARQFNRFRNIASDDVPQELMDINSEDLLGRAVPEKSPVRDDVRAYEQAQKAATAGAAAAIERLRPNFDVYANYAFNGRDAALGTALGNPFNANRPTYAVGMRFSMPLDRSVVSDAMAGYKQEQIASEMLYRQKLNDQRLEWTDLTHRIRELKQKLKLSKNIVSAQKAKLGREKERLSTGRTTTFQVLMFEGEYVMSRLAELGVKAELIQALTQLRLYGEAL